MKAYVEVLSDYLAVQEDITATGKTKIWVIYNKNNTVHLGVVKWYPQWRQYCFFPTNGTILSVDCMSVIEQFIIDHKRDRIVRD